VGGTTWTSAAGNGSLASLSSDRWTAGDTYDVEFTTTGYRDITISWDQTRTALGPRNFAVDVFIYDSAGLPRVLLSVFTYTVINDGAIGSGTNAWSTTGSRQSQFTHSLNLTTLPVVAGYDFGADNKGYYRVSFRALESGNGSNRIDNIMVTGTAFAVPAPGVMGLLSVGGFAGRRRRR
jgi:MYXO-CTERM domain-containing protein